MTQARGPRIVLLGKQGSGKGTQGELLAKRYGMRHLSTGEMFRDSADVGIAAGLEAKSYMDRGELVPDDIVVAVVEERFQNPREVEHGFVLDGFPRTSHQALELDRILGANALDLVIDLDVPTEVVVERMRSRGRDDDNEESIRRRLALYDSETKPLVDFYRERSLLTTIDGLGTEDEVAQAIVDAISSRFAAS
jgi:adenylate kinase